MSVLKAVSSFFSNLGKKQTQAQSASPPKAKTAFFNKPTALSEDAILPILKGYKKVLSEKLAESQEWALSDEFFPYIDEENLNSALHEYVKTVLSKLQNEKEKERLVLRLNIVFLEEKYKLAKSVQKGAVELTFAEMLVDKYEQLTKITISSLAKPVMKIREKLMKYKEITKKNKAKEVEVNEGASNSVNYHEAFRKALSIHKKLQDISISYAKKGQLTTRANIQEYKKLVNNYKVYESAPDDGVNIGSPRAAKISELREKILNISNDIIHQYQLKIKSKLDKNDEATLSEDMDAMMEINAIHAGMFKSSVG